MRRGHGRPTAMKRVSMATFVFCQMMWCIQLVMPTTCGAPKRGNVGAHHRHQCWGHEAGGPRLLWLVG